MPLLGFLPDISNEQSWYLFRRSVSFLYFNAAEIVDDWFELAFGVEIRMSEEINYIKIDLWRPIFERIYQFVSIFFFYEICQDQFVQTFVQHVLETSWIVRILFDKVCSFCLGKLFKGICSWLRYHYVWFIKVWPLIFYFRVFFLKIYWKVKHDEEMTIFIEILRSWGIWFQQSSQLFWAGFLIENFQKLFGVHPFLHNRSKYIDVLSWCFFFFNLFQNWEKTQRQQSFLIGEAGGNMGDYTFEDGLFWFLRVYFLLRLSSISIFLDNWFISDHARENKVPKLFFVHFEGRISPWNILYVLPKRKNILEVVAVGFLSLSFKINNFLFQFWQVLVQCSLEFSIFDSKVIQTLSCIFSNFIENNFFMIVSIV